MSVPRVYIATFPIIAVALLATACSSGGKTTSATVPASVRAHSAVTGIGEVDELINAALDHNTIEMAALTGYQKVACVKVAATSPGAAPQCRDDEADGQDVEALASTGCDNGWVRPEQVSDAYASALAGTPTLYAVYVPNARPNAFGANFDDRYVIVMQTGTHSDGSPSGVALHVNPGRVTWLQTSCTSIQQLVAPDLVRSWVVAPAGGSQTPSAGSTGTSTGAP